MQSWTVGKRLLGAFSITFVLILILLGLYVQQSRQSSQQLTQVLHTYNKKLDIANAIELATSEMQGAQRGLMLSYEAKDAASAPQYIQTYQDSAKKIDRQPRPVRAADQQRPRAHGHDRRAAEPGHLAAALSGAGQHLRLRRYRQGLRAAQPEQGDLGRNARRRQGHRGRAVARARRGRGCLRGLHRALAVDDGGGHPPLARAGRLGLLPGRPDHREPAADRGAAG